MKLTLKQQWRLRPLNSFLGLIDIKIGVTIVILFALLNKVAGVYGLIAVFTGGSFAQLSMYIYSVLTLVAFVWALKAVADEDARRMLYFAHLFFADHVISTAWTTFFAVVWWIYTPHDGRRQANSLAQEQLMHGGLGHNMTEAERTEAAMTIWKEEKDLAATVIIVGWCAKIYFAILVYSYAIHLRKGSYRSLPRTTMSTSQYVLFNRTYPEEILGEEEESSEDYYRIPSSATPIPPSSAGRATMPNTGTSVSSFTDFVSAPGRGRRSRTHGAPSLGGFSSLGAWLGGKKGVVEEGTEAEEELLFDSDELGHSKLGTTTEESTSVSSRDDEGRQTPGYSRERGGSTKRP